jgi:peptidoglycan/LPS O-acetylase OafA/YrhL
LTSLSNPWLPAAPIETRPPVPDTPSGRIAVVDGLRGIAILAVLVFHINLFGISPGRAVWERLYQNAAGIGWVGVDLFFVLSGFLITGILLQSRNREGYYRIFYARRTVRIFPLYYLSLALFFGVAPLALKLLHHGGAIHELIQPSSQIFAWSYILNWRIGLASYAVVPRFIHHFWSLSIEEQFYLAWPFVVRKLTHRSLMVFCAALIVMSIACRVVFLLLHMTTAAYALTFCRLDSLAIGAMVALAIRHRRYWRIAVKGAPLLTAVTLGGLVAIVGVTRDVGNHNFMMGTIGFSLWGLFFGSCLVILLSAREGCFGSRVASCRVFRFFGKYSYCLYVCHQPLIIALVLAGIKSDSLTRIFHSKMLAVLVMNGMVLLMAVAISLASWHLFEKHFLKLKKVLLFSPSAS